MLREDVAEEQVVPFANGYIQELLIPHSSLQVSAVQPATWSIISNEQKATMISTKTKFTTG